VRRPSKACRYHYARATTATSESAACAGATRAAEAAAIVRDVIASVDAMAWSYRARRRRGDPRQPARRTTNACATLDADAQARTGADLAGRHVGPGSSSKRRISHSQRSMALHMYRKVSVGRSWN
jgi:hypothetical protein